MDSLLNMQSWNSPSKKTKKNLKSISAKNLIQFSTPSKTNSKTGIIIKTNHF